MDAGAKKNSASPDRKMLRAELMGSHTHRTRAGVRVHIWNRDGKYLARGYLQRRPFGETLGGDELEASIRLRALLTEIESGAYVRPTEPRSRMSTRSIPTQMSLRQLIGDFLTEKRQLRGMRTTATYRARLGPVLAFCDLPTSRQRWPLVGNLDREFVIELRGHLFGMKTTRNGKAGGKAKSFSPRHIHNVLQCLQTVLQWASRPEINRVPRDWRNPLTPDLIPDLNQKDPFRPIPFPVEVRVTLVTHMDLWQLCQLCLSFVLPLRPAEATGILVEEVEFGSRLIRIGTRMEGGDFTKAGTSFCLPFPAELEGILHRCVAGRTSGPLLRSRKAFESGKGAMTHGEIQNEFQKRLKGIACYQDRKEVFRRMLRDMGGTAPDRLAAEFKNLRQQAGLDSSDPFYGLRSAVTTDMARTGMRHLELRYLTSHATTDILNDYVSLDPVGAMAPYFRSISPLLTSMMKQAERLGLG